MPTTPAKKPTVEVVDPRWLLKALGLTIAVAAVFSYLTLCLLIYQGSWQLMLHPSTKIDATPHVTFQAIRFDAAETGTPRLTGWWIPAESPTERTILFLHDGAGSLSNVASRLDVLHNTGVNIFAIDYRGFGQSDGSHPTEARMAEDTAAALAYLIDTRHIPATKVIPYGEGLGDVLATNLAASHAELPAVILDKPDPDAFARATTGGKSRLLPMRALMQEHFDLTPAIATLKTPKLFLGTNSTANRTLFRGAPDPKMSITFDPALASSDQAYIQAIERFLDEYAP